MFFLVLFSPTSVFWLGKLLKNLVSPLGRNRRKNLNFGEDAEGKKHVWIKKKFSLMVQQLASFYLFIASVSEWRIWNLQKDRMYMEIHYLHALDDIFYRLVLRFHTRIVCAFVFPLVGNHTRLENLICYTPHTGHSLLIKHAIPS